MATFKDFAILGAAGLFIGWAMMSTNKQDADKKVMAVEAFNLDAAQGPVYDACLSAMHRKKLRQGGTREHFCGCVAKNATDGMDQSAYPHISTALNAVVNDSKADLDVHYAKAALAFSQCAEEVATTFKSPQHVRAWCDKDASRASDPRCQAVR